MKLQNISGAYTISSNLSRIQTQKDGVTVEVDTSTEEAVITLPPLDLYPRVRIVDATGNASENPIRILPADGESIEGWGDITISENSQAMDFFPGSDDIVSTPDKIQPTSEKTFVVSGNVSSDDIKSLTSSFQFVQALTGVKRYDPSEIRLEYKPGETAYTFTGEINLKYGGTNKIVIPAALINTTNPRGITIREFADVVDYNSDIKIDASTNPTNGDGTIDYFITYKIIDYTVVE